MTFNPSGKLRLASCNYFFHSGVAFGPNLQGIEEAGAIPSFALTEGSVSFSVDVTVG